MSKFLQNAVFVALAVLTVGWCCAASAAQSVTDDAKIIASAGLKYIAAHQNPDGSYGDAADKGALVNKTAVVLYALASNSRKYRYESGPFVSDAADFLLKSQKEDGSFGDVDTTLNTVLALKTLKADCCKAALEKAAGFLKDKPTPSAFTLQGLLVGDGTALKMFGVPASLTDAKEAAAAVMMIKAMQELKNLTPAEFGKVSGFGDGPYADPVFATALACIVGDAIENNSAFK